jgi:PadR family transcriptional regulator, regulatory protein PadR
MANKGGDLSFMNGVPELLVLQLLAQKEMYGYEVVRAIGESTGQVIAVGEGCVYPILHAMERKKWVATRRLVRDGRKRIYYRLTDAGRDRLQSAAARWSQLTGAVSNVLGAANVRGSVI